MLRNRIHAFALSFAAAAGILPALGASPATGLQPDVMFTDYSPLSGNAELARRTLTPLTAARMRTNLAARNETLAGQPVDLAKEHFLVYVPAQEPPDGYGLLVFVPPWPDARLPDDWASALDQRGVIFVSAAQSGNAAGVLARRMPLALLAEQNIVHRYPVNPRRIYIGGFSGGSRVAMRLALAYPDIFRGALLDAGADPIGTAEISLPPQGLFEQFQDDTRLIYLTGTEDIGSLGLVAGSVRSMRDWCVFHVEQQELARTGHDVISASVLLQALDALARPIPDDAEKLAACRAAIETELSAKLDKVQSLLASGDRTAARALLSEIDKHYGGLAAPESLALSQATGATQPR